MPQKKKPVKLNSLNKLLEIAKKNHGELVSAGLENISWENLGLSSRIPLADFVEKRFIGMNENNIQVEHDINMTPFRLEHVQDSPRKKAAEVIMEKYQECYETVTDMRFEQMVLSEAQRLVQERTYELDTDQRRQLIQLDSDKREDTEKETIKLMIYQNFFASFFKENAVLALEPGKQYDPIDMQLEREVLGEIAAALPEGPEYDIYRTRDGYAAKQPLPMAPRAVTMVMNPNVVTNITVDDFPASIRAANPSRGNLEWGASTFDNMLETLYNKDEWEDLKKNEIDLLKTVYLDGRPVTDQFQERKHGEAYEDYAKRIKSELVARALEGKGKLDVVPYRKVNGEYSFGDPVPVNVKINLKEKVSAWKRFLRFFNVKIELKKERAERLSLEDLNGEERREEIKRDAQRVAARENVSLHIREKLKETQYGNNRANHDFFGYLVPGSRPDMNPAFEAKYFERLNRAVLDQVNGKISPEVAEELGMPGMKTVSVMDTMGRSSSRTSMVRLYALSKGMSLEDVLSPAPELRARKEEIGREFMDLITVKGSDEFHAENGPEADYKAYFKDKSQKVYDTFLEFHHIMSELPFDYFKGTSPEELAENYDKISFVSTASQDIFQCCPRHVKAINFNQLDGLEQKIRSVGELGTIEDYCENYLATDTYVKSNLARTREDERLVKALATKVKCEQLVADTAGMTKLGDISTVLDEQWTYKAEAFRGALVVKGLDPQGLKEISDCLENGGRPNLYFDEKTQMYVEGTAKAVERAQAERQQGIAKREAVSFKEFDDTKKKPAIKPLEKQKELQKAPMQKKRPQLE